ncbi:MAG TPA: GAF domain-containing protein [Thermoanaerobaculia bacterium]|nr:GAF domain-containing protein [Thermoanaerobaculia bacterium]
MDELRGRIDGLSRDEALPLLLDELRRVVPYDSCSVQELRSGRLVIVGGVGFADLELILGESFEVDNSDIPNSEVIHRRRPLVVADTDKYRAFRRGLHVGQGIRSWLGVPLLDGDALIGMIALDKAEAEFYTPEHQKRAMEISPLLARVLVRARHEMDTQTA